MKKALSFLATMMLLGTMAIQAQQYDFYETSSDGQRFYYVHQGSGKVWLTSGTSSGYSSSELTSNYLWIDDSVTHNGITYAVVGIDDNTFKNCSSLTWVYIPSTVTRIGDYAFYNCSGLTSIYMSDSLTHIGEWAFSGCSGLDYFFIPNTVTDIGKRAFYNCTGLTELTISESVTSIGESAFMSCTNLQTINFNAINCTTWGGLVFAYCENINTINIGNNVTRIPAGAFFGCGNSTNYYSGLRSITIPRSVRRIGNGAFGSCYRLETVYFNADSCITMGSENSPVFNGCSSFTSLNLGSNVKNIPNFAFKNCSGLTTITIPDSVERIGAKAFVNCTSLTSITIGNSVTSIGTNAFLYCSNLRNIVCNAVYPPSADINTFIGLPNNRTCTVPCGSLQYYRGDNTTNTWLGFQLIEDCPEYTITAVSGDPTMGSVSGGGTYNSGATATLTATPNSGYRFVRWQDNNTQNPRTVTVTANATYTATFEAVAPTQYTVTVNSNNSAWGSVSGGGTYNSGATATLTATPNSGYSFVRWQDNNTQNPRTVTVTANATYTATFEAVAPTQYTVTVNSNNSAWGSVSGGGTYNSGATATLTATPNSGYRFVRWQDNNTQNPRTVTVTANATYTAYFEAADTPGDDPINGDCIITQFPYTESFDGDLSCWKIYDPDNDGTNDGLNSWNFFNSVGFNSSICAGIRNTNTAANYSSDYLFSPYITIPGTYTISYKMRCYEESTLYYAAWPEFSVAQTPSPSIDSVSSTNWVTKSFSFTLNAGDTAYITFAYATSGGSYLLLDDITFTRQGNTPTQYTITVNSNNNSWGTVSGGGTYISGATATLTATPNSGYRFVRWQDNNTQNPRTVTVTANVTYTAYFEAETQGIDDVAWNGIGLIMHGTTLIISGVTDEHVRITDLMGRTIHSANCSGSMSVELPVAGVYFVRVGDRPARKIMVVR